jgi:hypothetical protein
MGRKWREGQQARKRNQWPHLSLGEDFNAGADEEPGVDGSHPEFGYMDISMRSCWLSCVDASLVRVEEVGPGSQVWGKEGGRAGRRAGKRERDGGQESRKGGTMTGIHSR